MKLFTEATPVLFDTNIMWSTNLKNSVAILRK